MNIEEKIIKEFRSFYKKAYKDILPPEILDYGNDWFEEFIREALKQQKKSLYKEFMVWFKKSTEHVEDAIERILK